MKQLLFLLLFPCLCVAQYTGNAGQKITLGEQSTADGLVYRGLAADTTRKPSVDTMAYILLDTNTNIIWQYKKATNNAWTRVGGSISSGVTGVLPVANGGTGSTSLDAADIVTKSGTQSITGLKTFNVGASSSLKVLGTAYPSFLIESSSSTQGTSVDFKTTSNSSSVWAIGKRDDGINSTPVGSLWVYNGSAGTTAMWISPSNAFQFNGAATFSSLIGENSRTVNAAADGSLSASSSITIKENVNNLNYGLDKILQLQPKSFNYIDKNKYGEGLDIGFIAEDVYNIIPEATGTMNDSFIYFDAVKLIPVLTKAIQEQQALIKALQQRILILENK